MDAKITVEVICIHCNGTIRIAKAASQQSCRLKCPGCQRVLQLMFNVSTMPQRYAFLNPPAEANKKAAPASAQKDLRKTMPSPRNESVITSPGENPLAKEPPTPCAEAPRRPVDPKKTVYRRKPGSSYDARQVYSGNRIPGEDCTRPEYSDRSERNHKPTCYVLTQKKMFGLKSACHHLYTGTNIVGRKDYAQPSDISIEGDDTVSRRSVEITILRDRHDCYSCSLRLLSASNPVRVNSRALRTGESVELAPGDTIYMGHTTFKFEKQ
ncbi:MAG: FHA domain-containing protein [Muribaculaceae bacterium]|nr:FHA domain-containing protein [Muribaculaceae bacterium]